MSSNLFFGSDVILTNKTFALVSGSNINILSGSIRAPLIFNNPGIMNIIKNAQGNITSISGSNLVTTINYNTAGNVKNVVYNQGGINYTGSINYDSAGNVTSVVYNN